MKMKDVLAGFNNKKVEISYGSVGGISGNLVEVGEEVAVIVGENDVRTYVAIDKIVAVNEAAGNHSRPGFVI